MIRLGLACFLLAASPAFARDSLGVFEDWAAFRDPASGAAPLRCYAIAQPAQASAPGFYATITQWPAARVRGQLHIRLPRSVGGATLSIADRRFALVTRGAGAWAADARADAAIVAAMRSGTAMRFSAAGVSASWRLRGAATAIDAAVLGCARR